MLPLKAIIFLTFTSITVNPFFKRKKYILLIIRDIQVSSKVHIAKIQKFVNARRDSFRIAFVSEVNYPNSRDNSSRLIGVDL